MHRGNGCLAVGVACLLLAGCASDPWGGYGPGYGGPYQPYGQPYGAQPEYRPYNLPPPVRPDGLPQYRPYGGGPTYRPYDVPPSSPPGEQRFDDRRGYGSPAEPPYGSPAPDQPNPWDRGGRQEDGPAYRQEDRAPYEPPSRAPQPYGQSGEFPPGGQWEDRAPEPYARESSPPGLGAPTWR
ncbi:hypothetical protein [Roseomonas chloroacetimidivorans]|uniref:hypothetical protein n=1 Tax=Roseomonas chloroacetimidivorans TaxID=1766656 RepID=UPI003C735BD2